MPTNTHTGAVYEAINGALYRVREALTFAGRDLLLVEKIRGRRGDVVVVEPRFLEGLTEASVAEWRGALVEAKIAEHERQAAARARADGERWGIAVDVIGWRGTAAGTSLIVRSTRTQLVDVDGSRWSRRTGKSIGMTSYRAVSRAGLDLVEDFLAGRDRVDIVVERKKSTQSDGRTEDQ